MVKLDFLAFIYIWTWRRFTTVSASNKNFKLRGAWFQKFGPKLDIPDARYDDDYDDENSEYDYVEETEEVWHIIWVRVTYHLSWYIA